MNVLFNNKLLLSFFAVNSIENAMKFQDYIQVHTSID